MEASGIKRLGCERFWLGVLLAPTLFGLIFGALGSVLATIVISFLNWDLLTKATWAGIDNYAKLFNDPKFVTSLSNTVKFSVMYVPGVVVVSLVVAMLMNRKIRGISLYRTMYFFRSLPRPWPRAWYGR